MFEGAEKVAARHLFYTIKQTGDWRNRVTPAAQHFPGRVAGPCRFSPAECDYLFRSDIMNKKQYAQADTQAKPAPRGPKAIVEDLHPKSERAITGGKITIRDIPIVIPSDKSST